MSQQEHCATTICFPEAFHGFCLQMELRYNEIERARNIYERYVQCIPSVKAWVRYAKFEMKNGQVGLARRCYERAVGEMGEDAQTVSFLLVAWGCEQMLFASCPMREKSNMPTKMLPFSQS